MTLISCAYMRLSTEAAASGKAAVICTYAGRFDLCPNLWRRGECPCAEEVIV